MNTRIENYLSRLKPSQVNVAKEAIEEYLKGESEDIKKISNAHEAYMLMRHISIYPIEHVFVILMKSNGRLIDYVEVGSGGLASCIADVRVALREALLHNATSMILVHNHPSGGLNPSKDDDLLTNSFKKAYEALQIRFFDHVIIGNGNYYSYAEHGRL